MNPKPHISPVCAREACEMWASDTMLDAMVARISSDTDRVIHAMIVDLWREPMVEDKPTGIKLSDLRAMTPEEREAALRALSPPYVSPDVPQRARLHALGFTDDEIVDENDNFYGLCVTHEGVERVLRERSYQEGVE